MHCFIWYLKPSSPAASFYFWDLQQIIVLIYLFITHIYVDLLATENENKKLSSHQKKRLKKREEKKAQIIQKKKDTGKTKKKTKKLLNNEGTYIEP